MGIRVRVHSSYLAQMLVFLRWSSHDVDLRGFQAQSAVHRHVLHRAVRRTDLNATLQHANKKGGVKAHTHSECAQSEARGNI